MKCDFMAPWRKCTHERAEEELDGILEDLLGVDWKSYRSLCPFNTDWAVSCPFVKKGGIKIIVATPALSPSYFTAEGTPEKEAE